MLNNMKISSRLTALLVFLLAGLVLIGGMGLYVTGKMNSELEEMLSLKVEPLVRLTAISKANLSNQLLIAKAVNEPENTPSYIQEIGKNKAEIDKHWEAFLKTLTDEEDRMLADKFAKVRGRFVEEGIKPAVAAMRANNVAEVKRIQIEKVTPLYTPLFEALDALIDMEKRDAEKFQMESAASFKTLRMIAIGLILFGLVLGIALGFSIISGVNRSVGELRGVMVKMSSDGDLSVRAKVYGQDEIGEATTAFNGLIDSFSSIIRQVLANSGALSSTAEQLSQSSLQIAQSSQAQSEASAATAASVEQVTVSISSVAANTEDIRQLAEKSMDQTSQGNQRVTVMVGEIQNAQEAVKQIAASVDEFVKSTQDIASMTQQVKDIAEQTNLLALNAAIEAARAGEQGRGFAVVADEVRKLAEKSAQSASEIDRVTGSLNGKSSHVETTVQAGLHSLQVMREQIGQVSAMLNEAGESVSQSTRGINDIATSVREQSSASTEIARNVEKIAQMSEENHAAVKSNTQDISHLEQLARELQAAVCHFRV